METFPINDPKPNFIDLSISGLRLVSEVVSLFVKRMVEWNVKSGRERAMHNALDE